MFKTSTLIMIAMVACNYLHAITKDDQTNNTKSNDEKNYPTAPAAYVLHGRYLFGAGQSNGWYYGKTVTVSGVVNTKDIVRISNKHLMNPEHNGKYLVPMMNGHIKCLTKKAPPYFSPASHRRSYYMIMKFRGTVKRAAGYKDAYIDDAIYLSSRRISRNKSSCQVTACGRYNKRYYTSRRNSVGSPSKVTIVKFKCPHCGRTITHYCHGENSGVKKKATPETTIRKTYRNRLVKTSELKHWCQMELQMNGNIGRRTFIMDSDPDSYAMELHYACKQYNLNNPYVTIKGNLKDKDNLYGTVENCSIVNWGDIKTKP